MKTRIDIVALCLLAAIVLSACTGATPPSPTRPPTAAPTSTPAPQPTATTDPLALHFVDIPEQIAPPGGTFNALDAYAFLRYRDFDADEMTWSVTGNDQITATIADGMIAVTPADPAWTGSETLRVEACEPAGACATAGIVYTVLDEASFSGVSVTYVGNSGFLITAGETKVLIDAFFEGFPDGYTLPENVQGPLLNAEPPFDGVDLILATHAHDDHFSAEMVRQHMQNNPQAVFISTTQAASQLADLGERVIAADPVAREPVQVEVDGIQVEAFFLSHGIPQDPADEIFNNGYVVTLDGITFFHTGDIASLQSFQPYALADREIDFAFVPHMFLNSSASQTTLERTVGMEYLFPAHYQYTYDPFNPDLLLQYHPQAVVFYGELGTWTMPLPATAVPPQPTATRTDSGEYVEFMTEDGVRLVGTYYPAPGNTAIVFAHMGISDQTAWQGFAARLAGEGMPALTFDFRCYGLSDCLGGDSSYYTTKDIRAAIGYLQGRGFERIVCAGASMGAAACVNAALREDLAGLVFIAGPRGYPLENLSYPRDLINPGMPKLFIVSEQDRYTQVVPATTDLYTASPDPKQLVTYPSTLHGTELFDSGYGEQFSQVLLDFLLSLDEQP